MTAHRVICPDCDLDNTFGSKELAIRHGLDHNTETGHITNVEQAANSGNAD